MDEYRRYRRLLLKLLRSELKHTPPDSKLTVQECRRALSTAKEILQLEQAELLDHVL